MRRLVLATLLLAAPAAAQELNLSGTSPVEITARDAIEWRQTEQVVLARGAARAVRDGVTITADRLIARYRPRAAAPSSGTPSPGTPSSGTPSSGTRPPSATPEAQGASPLSGPGNASQIWRLEAEGNVRIFSATDTATADHAVYDMDQSVLVLTGSNLSLSNAQDRLVAKDALEYWPQRRMAVARGDAQIDSPGRRLNADTLVAWFLEAVPPPPAGSAPRQARAGGTPGQPDTGRLDRAEAFGNVVIRTEAETVQGDRGAYNALSGIALLGGNVRITRGQNQLNGELAEVNMKTGISRLLPGQAPGERVSGLVVPQGGGPGALPLGAPRSQP